MATNPVSSPYPSRKTNFGLSKEAYSERFDPLLIKAISEYQTWHEVTFGRRVSRSDIFATSVLQHNDRIREIYRKLENKERKGDRKYIDGIKDSRSNAHPHIDINFDNI